MKKLELFEAIGDIDDELIDEANKKEASVRRWGMKKSIPWVAAAACLVLIMVGLLRSGSTNADIAINPIGEGISAAPLYFDPDTHHDQPMTDAEIATYYGKDYTALKFSGLQYEGSRERTIKVRNDGAIVYDAQGYTYQGQGKSLRISVGKMVMPYDVLYEFEATKPSKINQMEIIIGGEGLDKATQTYDELLADFTWQGIQYRVTGSELTVDEFTEALKTLLQ